MSVLTLTIDEQPVSAREGDTLLQAARDAGIRIPTLCQLDGIHSVGACRLCLVEVEGTRRPLAACVTRAAEGMVVRTANAQLIEYRRMTLELLLAERNHVCSVCVASGQCELQDLAAQLGIDHIRFEYQFPQYQVDISHPQFGHDPNRCILCTRCVRVCDEIEGAHTWDVAGRGSRSTIIADLASPWGDSLSCTSCGKCVQACPTGAMFRRGMTVAEMHRDRNRLSLLVLAREKKQWLL